MPNQKSCFVRMSLVYTAILFCLAIWMLFSPTLLMATTEQTDCVGKYKGKQIPPKTLVKILKNHAQWLNNPKRKIEDPQRANLCGAKLRKTLLIKAELSEADLREADLRNADLSLAQLRKTWLDKAKLQGANLFKANLTDAYLFSAQLRFANLEKANLSGAELKKAILTGVSQKRTRLMFANLSNADLYKADLTYTDLHRANLTKADLGDAKLVHANLTETILTKSILYNADLEGAHYFPQAGTLPDIFSFTTAQNYEKMRYYDPKSLNGAPGLVELRAAYKKAGMRQMERKLTNLIRTEEQRYNWEHDWKDKEGKWGEWARRGESWLYYILFDLTSAYSFAPQRPLWILLGLFVFFGFVYWLLIRFFKAKVSVMWPSYKMSHSSSKNSESGQENLSDDKSRDEIVTYYRKSINQLGIGAEARYLEFRMIRLAYYLSLLSAFRIGWQNYDYGNWSISHFIKLLQHRDYSLEVHKGLLRRLCGLQSLLSIYLFILWLIIFFGSPFK